MIYPQVRSENNFVAIISIKPRSKLRRRRACTDCYAIFQVGLKNMRTLNSSAVHLYVHKQGNRWAFKRCVVCVIYSKLARENTALEPSKKLKALLLNIRTCVHMHLCALNKRSHSASCLLVFGMHTQDAGENVSDAWLGHIIAALQSTCSSAHIRLQLHKVGFFKSLRAYFIAAGIHAWQGNMTVSTLSKKSAESQTQTCGFVYSQRFYL